MPARLQRLALPLAALVLGLAALGSLAFGDLPISPARIWNGLTHSDELAATILYHIRLPRLGVAALVGAALSASGLVMQAYFRNSLASPGLLGVSTGGAAGAVIAIGTGWAASSLLVLPAASIIGAFAATYAVITFARQGASTERLLLAGIALNALLGAVVSYVLSNFTLSYERNAQIIFWMIGGLEDRSWEHVFMALPIVLAALCLLPLGRPMDLLSLGEREAQSLGVDVRRLRAALLILSTILTALATAVSGSIGFVGLIVPHILRLLFGAEHKRLLPLSLIGGAAFMIACDLLGRFAADLRVGIVTSLIGGPFFLWLLRKKS
jgi:iron complex transport system permease protein